MGCNASKQEGYEGQGGDELEVISNDAGKSAELRAEALRVADDMFALTKGKRFHESYTRLTLTSYGASCKVLTAYHRLTNKKVAVKTIPKSRKNLERQRLKVKLEIGTFRLVEDHPNAVRVLEVFEGAECYYIVMECCEGGELFDHISKKQGFFTERQAAHLLRSLMLFMAHMHGKGIAHLDIKPENIMFDSEGASGVLKVLDFGSSVFVQPNETVRNAFGTVRYASPEMANDVCGQKADVWSAGVVMYTLLCGKAPFLKHNDMDTLNLIKSGPKVKFAGERWSSISQAAKDCIRALLEPNPRQRPTAAEVLTMPWLKQQVPETVIVPDTLQHLRVFANQSRIRRLLLGLMADQLVGSGANQLLGQFYTLDRDFSGTLEVSELIKAAKEAIPDISDHEINRMFEALDVDKTGTVDIKEFFAGLIQTIDEEKQTLVAQKSFTMMDKRGAGFVTKEAFMEVLLEKAQAGTLRTLAPKAEREAADAHGAAAGGEGGPHPRASTSEVEAAVLLDPGLVSELESEFANLDANGDGVLSFEEFKAILGIKSTPEGLQLAQSQLAAAPSIQEGMDALAQQLRTRTGDARGPARQSYGGTNAAAAAAAGAAAQSSAPSGAGRAGSNTSAAAAAAAAAAKAAGGPSGAGRAPSTGGPLSNVVKRHSSGGASRGDAIPALLAGFTNSMSAAAGSGGGGAAGARNASHADLSVDRAAMDLEQPDLETRDLLQLLAPAKGVASALARSHSQAALASGGAAATPGPSSGPFGPPSRSASRRDATLAALLHRAASVGRTAERLESCTSARVQLTPLQPGATGDSHAAQGWEAVGPRPLHPLPSMRSGGAAVAEAAVAEASASEGLLLRHSQHQHHGVSLAAGGSGGGASHLPVPLTTSRGGPASPRAASPPSSLEPLLPGAAEASRQAA